METNARSNRIAILLPFILIITNCSLFAQDRQIGLSINDSEYSAVTTVRYGKTFADTLKDIVSLKKFCPVIGDQQTSNTCTAWATGYSALAISHNIKNSILDSTYRGQTTFSVMFLYNHIIKKNPKLDCDSSTSLIDAFDIMKNIGNCLFQSFNPKSCKVLPSKENFLEAGKYKISDYKCIFKKVDNFNTKIDATIKTLSRNLPVIVAMKITPSFFLNDGTSWSPNELDSIIGAHALVVVGYNNKTRTFELMNSYGPNWKNNGFFNMTYADFQKMSLYGYFIRLPKE